MVLPTVVLALVLASAGCASVDAGDGVGAGGPADGETAADSGARTVAGAASDSGARPAAGAASDGESPGAPDVGRPSDATGATPAPGKKANQNYAFEIEAPKALAQEIREKTFVGRWQRRDDYDPVQFEGLVARLRDEVEAILRSRGYYDGRIRIFSDPGARVISLAVRAGARTTVNQVEIALTREGEPDEKLTEFVRRAWALPAGSFFESGTWQSGKRAVIEALNARGFLRARLVDSAARVDPALTAASLRLTIEIGPRIGFGELKIEGLERYDRRVVETQRTFSVGDPYDFEKMVAFQTRLRQSGYFDEAIVVPDLQALAENPDEERVPLRVQLVEKESKRIALGIGYSTDEGVRGQVGLEHRNLFNRNWRLESAVVLSQVRARAFANVRTPVDENNRFLGFGSRLEREDVEGQLSTSSNTYIGLGWRRDNGDSFLSLQYQSEALKLEPDANGPGLRDQRQALVLGLAWNQRRLDSALEPRRGYVLNAQISGAHESVLSTRGFLRMYGRATRFFSGSRDSAFENGTLIITGELGVVRATTREDIPSENLFRAGGARSVRGYSYLSLGVPERGAIVGGRYLATGSLEYQHRMSDLWSLAAFIDIGNAGDDADSFDPVAGAGLGVRFRTPVGPIQLDAAYGEAVDRWRLHFSVGYGF